MVVVIQGVAAEPCARSQKLHRSVMAAAKTALFAAAPRTDRHPL